MSATREALACDNSDSASRKHIATISLATHFLRESRAFEA
jgi:hypothetical protein